MSMTGWRVECRMYKSPEMETRVVQSRGALVHLSVSTLDGLVHLVVCICTLSTPLRCLGSHHCSPDQPYPT